MSIAQFINGVLRKIPVWTIYIVGPIPGYWVLWLAINNELGADPLRTLEHLLGENALRFIIVTLLVTPIRKYTRVNLLRFRRAFGLVAFFYVVGHMLTWLILDQQLVIADIIKEIIKRPYITIGMIGFLAMAPLAITSNNYSVRKLGTTAWSNLHRLAYVAAIAGALHYVLIVKSWPPEPIVYASIILVLLLIRLWWYIQRQVRYLSE